MVILIIPFWTTKFVGSIDAGEIQESFRKLGVIVDRKEAERLLQRMDKDGTLKIDWTEWRDYLILSPTQNIHDILHYWRHATVRITILLPWKQCLLITILIFILILFVKFNIIPANIAYHSIMYISIIWQETWKIGFNFKMQLFSLCIDWNKCNQFIKINDFIISYCFQI